MTAAWQALRLMSSCMIGKTGTEPKHDHPPAQLYGSALRCRPGVDQCGALSAAQSGRGPLAHGGRRARDGAIVVGRADPQVRVRFLVAMADFGGRTHNDDAGGL